MMLPLFATLMSALVAWLAPIAAQDHLTRTFTVELRGRSVRDRARRLRAMRLGRGGRESVALTSDARRQVLAAPAARPRRDGEPTIASRSATCRRALTG